ncbi:hypothetical protein [Agromyces badenianii]|uniref:hypothetical protein n=1 Tax=Agromyces badenianii TaxID=2080742 RepID=UPI0011B29EA1|nr:hypothetical protein [Agromyces badenianii]
MLTLDVCVLSADPSIHRIETRDTCSQCGLAERMRTGRLHQRRLVVAATCLILATFTLAACSFRTEPPQASQQTAADLAASVEELRGVHSAKATVNDVDLKDKPGEWYVQLTVDADSAADINGLPFALAPVLDDAQLHGQRIRLALRIPGGPGIASTTLGAISGGNVRTAIALRSVPGVLSVDGASYSPKLLASMAPSTTLTTILPTLRDALRAGGDEVPSVMAAWTGEVNTRFSVDVSSAWPSEELVTALEKVGRMSSLRYLAALQRTESMPMITADLTKSADVTVVADLLREVTDSGSPAGTHFSVNGPNGEQLTGTI